MRPLPLLLCAALLTAGCTEGPGDAVTGATPDGHAKELESEFQDAAEDVLPPLVGSLHGTLQAMPAHFVGCQVGGMWRYLAQGEVHDPTGSAREVAQASRAVLEDQGFEVTDDGAGVEGTRGAVTVRVSGLLESEQVDFSMVRIDLVPSGDECENYSDSDEEYAEQASERDYADLL